MSVYVIVLVLALGLVTSALFRESGLAGPEGHRATIYYYLFAYHESIPLWIQFALIVAGAPLVFSGASRFFVIRRLAPSWPSPTWPSPSWIVRQAPALAAVAVAGLTTAASFSVLGHSLSMDEFASEFQARIFAAGQLRAQLSSTWAPYGAQLSPIWVAYDPATTSWTTVYLPVYATARGLLIRFGELVALPGLDRLLNPLLATLSVLLVGAIGRRLWTDSAPNLIAVLSLAASAQFLFMSTSAYAMPAHLCLNLLWILLYVRNTPRALALVPWVGVAALGLHQPNVHALFVLPFLLRIVLTGRWRLAGYFALVYGLGLLFWLWWLRQVRPWFGEQFAFPDLEQLLLQITYFATFVSWQWIPTVLLCLVAIFSWRSLPALPRDLTLGIALSLLLPVVAVADQGHGWGYRYLHAVLGNVAILAGFGWLILREHVDTRRAASFATLCLAVTALILIPLKAVQSAELIAPFARANDYLSSLKENVVYIRSDSAWYAHDLVRNDPWLTNTPKIMSYGVHLRSGQPEPTGRVRLITSDELGQLGLRGTAAQQQPGPKVAPE